MARRGDDIRFGFATGRVMVLRTRLLDRGTYERLLDAYSLEEQRRILSESHFGRFLEDARTASDIERGVDASLADLYAEFLERADLPSEVVAYFRAPYDFQALKAVLKSRALGRPAELPAVLMGSLAPEQFEVPETLEGALGAVADAVLGAQPPLDTEAIDEAVDRSMFAELERLARASRIELLKRLAASEADIANAKVLLRSAIARRGRDVAARMLVPGGRWDARKMLDLVARPDDLASAVAAARVLPADRAADLLDLTKLDVLADAAVARLARDATRMAVGAEPVLGYVLARRSEAASVRAALVGRLSGLSRDVIAGRLREVAS